MLASLHIFYYWLHVIVVVFRASSNQEDSVGTNPAREAKAVRGRKRHVLCMRVSVYQNTINNRTLSLCHMRALEPLAGFGECRCDLVWQKTTF